MKKPTKRPLRATSLDSAALEAASGGRGIRYGWWYCDCGASGSGGSECWNCGSGLGDFTYQGTNGGEGGY